MSGEQDSLSTEGRTSQVALALSIIDGYTRQPIPTRLITATPTTSGRGATGSIPAYPQREQSPDERPKPLEGGLSSNAVSVSLKNVDVAPVVNPSGYLLFFESDLTEDEVTLEVRSGGQYRNESRTVAVQGRADPVETVELQPLSSYPFPNQETLLRGSVFVVDERPDGGDGDVDPDTHGAEGVTLTIGDFDVSTNTLEGGAFIVAVTGLTADNRDDDGLVTVNGRRPEVTTTLGPEAVPIRLAVGTTTCYQLAYDSNGDVAYRQCGGTWRRPPSL